MGPGPRVPQPVGYAVRATGPRSVLPAGPLNLMMNYAGPQPYAGGIILMIRFQRGTLMSGTPDLGLAAVAAGLRELTDRTEIASAKAAYCRAADAVDVDGMLAIFTADCQIDFAPEVATVGKANGVEELRRVLRRGPSRCHREQPSPVEPRRRLRRSGLSPGPLVPLLLAALRGLPRGAGLPQVRSVRRDVGAHRGGLAAVVAHLPSGRRAQRGQVRHPIRRGHPPAGVARDTSVSRYPFGTGSVVG